MRVVALLLVGLAGSFDAQAGDPLAVRHALINQLYQQEKYAEAITAITLQRKEAQGTPWQDSLYTYTYELGRAHWKTIDADAGIRAAEEFCEHVRVHDKDPVHVLESMADLARLFFEVGRIAECLRVDSMAVPITDAHPQVPLIMRGKARHRVALDLGAMGDHERAIGYYLQAKAVYERSDTVLAIQLAETCNGLGVSNWHLGRTREAEKYYRMALDHLGDGQDIERLSRRTNTNGNLGILWQNAGDLTRSKDYYQESLRAINQVIAASTDPSKRDAAILNRAKAYLNLATVYFAIGDEGRAADLLDMSLRDRTAILEPGDPKLLLVKDRMASLEFASGDVGRAEKLVIEYMQACSTYYGRESEDYIMAASKLAEIVAYQGRNAQADSLFNESIELARRLADADTDPGLALTYRRRSAMYQQMHRYAEALTDLQRSRSVLQRIHGDNHYKVAQADAEMADVSFRSGDTALAATYSKAALDLLADRISALKASAVPQTFPEPGLLADAVYWSVRAQRTDNADAGQHERWSNDIDLAILALERNKLALGDEASRLSLIGSQERLFDLALDVAYDAHARSGSSADAGRFLSLSEADRSILLKSRLNEFAGMRFAGVPDSIIAREEQLLLALDIDPEDRATTVDLARKEKDYNDFLLRLSRDHPAYFALRYGETRVALEQVRKDLLTPERNLLIYAVTSEHLYALVIRTDTTALVRMDNAGIAGQVKALNASIAARATTEYFTAAHALYTTVLAPVAHLLTGTELLIIPDGPLHTVNFETLLTAPASARDFRDHLLLQRYAIAYLLSATTAVQFANMARERPTGVLAIAPGFTDDLKQEYLSGVQDTALVDHRYLQYVRQPFAVSTAQDLGSTLSAKVMVGGEASEAGFRVQAARYGILHLGTHAEMNATSPMYSRLVLSKGGSGVDADGYLHAYEIYELDLRAQLAVLTACETGAGLADAGEGVRSLGYGFAYAGCPSLVMSLWKIDEKTSAEIITRFYENLAQGMPKHQALRRAKLDHLAQARDELALPYYWAGLVLVGDVSPVDPGSAWRRYIPWAAGGLALLLAIFVVRWRVRSRAQQQ